MAPDDQLVVVDDGSTDETQELVEGLCRDVTYVPIPHNEGYRLCTRINQGLSVAENDMVWRLDCDCVPFSDSLAMLKELHRKDRIIAGAVQYEDEGGRVANADHAWRLKRFHALRAGSPQEYEYWTRTGEVFDPAFCFGGNLCFSRSEALACGGFDTDFDGGWGAEDAWFAEKMMFQRSARLLYAPGIAVVHQWHSQEGTHRTEELRTRNHQLWKSKSWALRWPEQTRVGSGVWAPRRESEPCIGGHSPYALLTITGPDMVNAGNLVVELALLTALPRPALVTSVFREPTPEVVAAIANSGATKAICSGTTVYGDGTPLDRWAQALGDIPLVVVGGCYWSSDRSRPTPADWSNLLPTARDPFTARHLQDAIEAAPYVGCPSLLLQERSERRTGNSAARIGLGFHRRELVGQLNGFAQLLLETGKPATLLVQEKHELIAARLFQDEMEGQADISIAILGNMRSLSDWEDLFSSLECCVSGRLHQVLPAASMGVPSVLFAPTREDLQDSRYTLLEDLEVPCACLEEVPFTDLPGVCGVGSLERLVALRAALTRFLKEVNNDLAT